MYEDFVRMQDRFKRYPGVSCNRKGKAVVIRFFCGRRSVSRLSINMDKWTNIRALVFQRRCCTSAKTVGQTETATFWGT